MKKNTIIDINDFDLDFRVRYIETDKMGVVYHANYLVWFEMGRTEKMRKQQISYKVVEGAGIMLPVIEACCKYKSAARYDDVLSVKTVVTEVTGTRILFNYLIYRKDDQVVIAEGRTEHAFINMEYKPLNIKKTNPEIYKKLADMVIVK